MRFFFSKAVQLIQLINIKKNSILNFINSTANTSKKIIKMHFFSKTVQLVQLIQLINIKKKSILNFINSTTNTSKKIKMRFFQKQYN